MLEKIKQNPSLFIGFSIPVLMVLLVAGIIYVPQIFDTTPPPQYDFVYATGDGMYYPMYGTSYYSYPYYSENGARLKYVYHVADGKIIKEAAPKDDSIPMKAPGPLVENVPKFYVHHSLTNISEELSFDAVSQLTLDTSAKSPDGYEVVRGSTGGGDMFPFFYGRSYDYTSKYLKNGHTVIKLNLNLPENYYNEFFIGWVKK